MNFATIPYFIPFTPIFPAPVFTESVLKLFDKTRPLPNPRNGKFEIPRLIA